MIMTDCHMHSSFSGDSETPMEEMIRSAIDKGLKTICFTEHMDPDYPSCDCDFKLDTEPYRSTLMRLKESYADRIEILFGVEFGMQKHLVSYYNEYIQQYPFDFIICSAHLVNGTDPYYKENLKGISDRQLYRQYFSCVLECLNLFDGFQSLGHLDYIVRYGIRQAEEYHVGELSDLIDEILKTLIRRDIALECNSAGLKYGLGFAHPHTDILKRYRALGGDLLTIGADAHAPQHIAYGFDRVSDTLKACGFDAYTIYRDRSPIQIPL